MPRVTVMCVALMMLLSLQPSYADLGRDLVGLWLFDEGSGDIIGDATENQEDGEIVNGKWVAGRFGTALEFNGSDTCVTIPHSESLSIEDDQISFTAWFTQDGSAAGDWHTIVCKGPYIGGQIDENWAVFTNSGAQYICTTLTLENAGRWWTTSGDGSLPVDGEWHHFASTYDGTELTYYLDGNLVNTEVQNGNMVPNDRDMTIGCRSNDGIQWGGVLDEIAIFHRALSEAEIQDIMNRGYAESLGVEPSGRLPTVWGKLKK